MGGGSVRRSHVVPAPRSFIVWFENKDLRFLTVLRNGAERQLRWWKALRSNVNRHSVVRLPRTTVAQSQFLVPLILGSHRSRSASPIMLKANTARPMAIEGK